MNRIFVLQKISGMFGRIADVRHKRKSLRVVARLPDHIRKDIGWPGRGRAA